MTKDKSPQNKNEVISKPIEKQVNRSGNSRNYDRIKPLCDRVPDTEATSNVRVPENRRIVKGIFKNLECPGTMLTFCFRKYKEPIKTYYLMDGNEYDLPIEVIEHINSNCGYKKHEWKLENKRTIANEMGGRGSNKAIASVISRFMFTPLDYLTA